MWIYDHFFSPINITRYDTMYSHSTEVATALLRDNAAALAEFVLSEHILTVIAIAALCIATCGIMLRQFRPSVRLSHCVL